MAWLIHTTGTCICILYMPCTLVRSVDIIQVSVSMCFTIHLNTFLKTPVPEASNNNRKFNTCQQRFFFSRYLFYIFRIDIHIACVRESMYEHTRIRIHHINLIFLSIIFRLFNFKGNENVIIGPYFSAPLSL